MRGYEDLVRAGAGAGYDVKAGDPPREWDADVDTWRATIEERVDQFTEAFDHTYTGAQLHSWEVVETVPVESGERDNTYRVSVMDSVYRTRVDLAYNTIGYRYGRERHVNLNGTLGELTSLTVGDQRDWFTQASGKRVEMFFTEEGSVSRIEYRSEREKDLITLSRIPKKGWTLTSDHPEKNVNVHMERIGKIVTDRQTPVGAKRVPYRPGASHRLDHRGLKI